MDVVIITSHGIKAEGLVFIVFSCNKYKKYTLNS